MRRSTDTWTENVGTHNGGLVEGAIWRDRFDTDMMEYLAGLRKLLNRTARID
jgi:hypothetical protein